MAFEEKQKTILLVSDNLVDISKIGREFMDTGGMDCRLHHSATMADALEHLNKKELKPDIIIVDLRLKGAISPREIYKAMEAGAHDIPIIVLTDESKEAIAVAAALMKDDGASGKTDRSHLGILVNTMRALLFKGNRR